MRSLIHLRERLFNRPLLCTADYANIVATVLAERLGIEPIVSAETVQSNVRPAFNPVFDRNTGIVTYPIVGSMVHRGDWMSAESGVQSYTAMQNDLDIYARTMGVKGILLDLDTPGGEAAGITELGAWIADCDVPVWSLVNTKACSGGYWLASMTDRITAAPMSYTGSIGVVTMHQDVSKALERKGVVTTLIYAGDKKVDGNPYQELPDEVRASIQASVDDLYTQFVSAVASSRGMSESAVRDTQADVFSPEQALELGLVDALGSRADVLAQFSNLVNRTLVPGMSMESHTMKDLFTDADVAKARLEGAEEGKLAGIKLGHAAAVTSLTASFMGLVPDNAAVATFCETLQDGGSVELATKVAGRVAAATPKAAAAVEAPAVPVAPKTATQADVDAVLTAHAPNVSAGADQALTAKEARLAELNGSMKSFNRQKGYSGRA